MVAAVPAGVASALRLAPSPFAPSCAGQLVSQFASLNIQSADEHDSANANQKQFEANDENTVSDNNPQNALSFVTKILHPGCNPHMGSFEPHSKLLQFQAQPDTSGIPVSLTTHYVLPYVNWSNRAPTVITLISHTPRGSVGVRERRPAITSPVLAFVSPQKKNTLAHLAAARPCDSCKNQSDTCLVRYAARSPRGHP